MDIEAANQYTTQEYYNLLIATKFAGIVGVEICPEVIASMKPVVSFEDRPYTDPNGNHILRTVVDSDGNKGYFDATNIEIVEKIHPNIVWHLAYSLYEVLVSHISETKLLVVCSVNLTNIEKED